MIFTHKFDEAFAMGARIKVADIQRAVAEHYGLQHDELLSDDKRRRVARPRQIGMYLARGLTPRSYPEIARLFRKRDHSTVSHAIARIEKLAADNVDLYADIEAIADRVIFGE